MKFAAIMRVDGRKEGGGTGKRFELIPPGELDRVKEFVGSRGYGEGKEYEEGKCSVCADGKANE